MRGRVRARFNAVADLGSQFRTAITLASGDINDPVSTNQTLGGFYTRKTVALDQAFVQFTPKQSKALTLTGGKFGYPWYNTELTWDKDLNPEGAAQSLAFKLGTPVLNRVALVGFELPLLCSATSTTARCGREPREPAPGRFVPPIGAQRSVGLYRFGRTSSGHGGALADALAV